MLADNGFNYEVLTHAAKTIKNVPGMTCEVGVREGGGTKYIIDSLMENDDRGRIHICIDPYGSLPYEQSEQDTLGTGIGMGPYPNEQGKCCLADLYAYTKELPIEIQFFKLEDTEFFGRYGDGIPVYRQGKKEMMNTYALVYFDGPHSLKSTLNETRFFAHRSVPGTAFVYDDITDYYDHSAVRNYLVDNGWNELVVAASKASYVKV